MSNFFFFLQTIAEGKMITGDLGGKASTAQYSDAIIRKLWEWLDVEYRFSCLE